MKYLRHIKGALALSYITLNLTIGLIPLMILAVLKLLLPIPVISEKIYNMMLCIYTAAVRVDNFLLKHLLGIRFDVTGMSPLRSDRNYLVISNHHSWADILVLQGLLINGAPIIKFIVKKEILLIPLVGLICWAYEYPFVHRRSIKNKQSDKIQSGVDLNTLHQKLNTMDTHHTTIINFVEGTRFHLLKTHESGSPYKHLLKPKAGGFTHILNLFGTKLDTLLNITIHYDTQEPIFWNLLCGKCKRIAIHLEQIPIQTLLDQFSSEESEMDYTIVSNWLRQLWLEKDALLGQLSKKSPTPN